MVGVGISGLPFLVTMFFFFFKDGPSVGPDEINL